MVRAAGLGRHHVGGPQSARYGVGVDLTPGPEHPGAAVRLGEDDGRAALLVDGVVQSIAPGDADVRGGYWAAMLPAVRPQAALLLGLGGGTLANLLVRRWSVPPDRIVGVDDDPAILAAARDQGWLALPGLEIVQADAFAYLAATDEQFDFVAVDLYRADRFDARVLRKDVLHTIRTRLVLPGLVAVNLFVDARTERRVERLSAVFSIRSRVRVGANLVVHAQASARRVGPRPTAHRDSGEAAD